MYQYFNGAIKKHGWENFSIEVLEECESREKLDEREKFLDCKPQYKKDSAVRAVADKKAGAKRKATMAAKTLEEY